MCANYVSENALKLHHDGHLKPSVGWQLSRKWATLKHKIRAPIRELCRRPHTIARRSEILDRHAERVENLRHLFLNDATLAKIPMRNCHSHPCAAADRTAMNAYMNRLAFLAGYEPYNVSMAAADRGTRGSRIVYGEKDLAHPHRNDPLRVDDCIIMCDVDYYTDINTWLTSFKPVLLYTLFVTTPTGRHGGDKPDYAWRIENNEVEFRVAGGASYRHQLWDYTGDVVSVVDDYNRLCVYNIEQRDIPDDPMHRFVVLTPMCRVDPPYWDHLPYSPNPIRRKVMTTGDVNVMFEPLTNMVSISRNGAWNHVTLTSACYDAVTVRSTTKDGPLVVADVERILYSAGDKDPTVTATILYQCMGYEYTANVVKTNGTISYHPIGPLALTDGKETGQRTTTPLVSQPSVFPKRSVNSDLATVEGRINKVRNDVVPPPRYNALMREFVREIVSDEQTGSGFPLDVAAVRAIQCETRQQQRYNQVHASLSSGYKSVLKSFQKAEPYATINDPRNITTMAAELTTLLSAYTYPFKNNILKRHAWYGPGLTPSQTVDRLRAIAQRGDGFICVDYSRLDGSISKWLQGIPESAYMRWCNKNHRDQLRLHLRKIFVKRGRTENGVVFDPGYGTRSGSPTTTDGNTIMCAFVVYAAFREMGYTHSDAILNMGVVYGDDGAFANLPGFENAIKTCARELGLSIKVDIIPRGEPVPYLGRYFVDPMTSVDSFCDPLRTIGKLHLSANKNVSPEQAAVNKAEGYLATDLLTPVVSTWCMRVQQLTGLEANDELREEKFKRTNAWPQFDRSLIEASMAKIMGVNVSELRKMDEAVRAAQALDEFPVILRTQREVKITAEVDGEVVKPRPHLQPDFTQNELKPTATNKFVHSMDSNGKISPQRRAIAIVSKTVPVPGKVPGPRPSRSRKGKGKDRGAGPAIGAGTVPEPTSVSGKPTRTQARRLRRRAQRARPSPPAAAGAELVDKEVTESPLAPVATNK